MSGVEILGFREVPLGGLRAMTVRRTLPSRQRSLVGAWCFADHYGPDRIGRAGGMKVAPHPHTGLQTVSWLFAGEIEHRDSAGHHARVRPGELNLMTAGRGISHSEVSLTADQVLHGVQLWVALPDSARFGDPGFAHHAPGPRAGEGWSARVFLGSLLGDSSPVPTATPLLGAELVLDADATLDLDLDPGFEHGALVDRGGLSIDGDPVPPGSLGYLQPGRGGVRLSAGGDGARLLLLGGPPFEEQIVMWWNFVGRSHDEIAAFREEWQRQISRPGSPVTSGVVAAGHQVAPGTFGVVADRLPPIPAPELPGVRLKPRS